MQSWSRAHAANRQDVPGILSASHPANEIGGVPYARRFRNVAREPVVGNRAGAFDDRRRHQPCRSEEQRQREQRPRHAARQ
jgi:hypothetical protein